jgi:hypothetical protein
MRIRSREGIGTIVSVRLPLEPPSGRPIAEAA